MKLPFFTFYYISLCVINNLSTSINELKEGPYCMTSRNKIKSDTILKNFWKNNEHFADLFNAYLFHGNQVLKPEDLSEVDTDISSLIKFNGHAETMQKILDVVKKSAHGVEYVILGIENQSKIHYAMPLRHMLGDALSYIKQYREIAAQNTKNRTYDSSDEFLSKFKKTDRLQPVITICIYYGEDKWDGPRSLVDMLNTPEQFKSLVSDYKFNLIELRESGNLSFHNSDVNTIFNLSRFIYERNYDKINDIYRHQPISTELALVIGSITETQKIIDDALAAEKEGGKLNMCKALEELEERGRQAGKIEGAIKIYKKINTTKSDTIKNIMEDFSFDENIAKEYVERFW